MKKIMTLYPIIASILLLNGCSYFQTNEQVKLSEELMSQTNSQASLDKLNEDRRIYQKDQADSLIHMYVTIVSKEQSEKNDVSFYEMNQWYDYHDKSVDSPMLDVIVQEGTENGLEAGKFGYGLEEPNATIEIRGNSNRYASQKSYKLKLFDSAGLWNGQKTMNLNKHASDSTRVRNKLSFDYFKSIPNFSSLRTQFVQLHVKDMTESSQAGFVDYGLFTHIEQVNERFLGTHGLDPYGQLYKAIGFEFLPYRDKLKLSTDPTYDKKAFGEILEIKGYEDHSKLIKMLDDVNNYSIPINDVINEHFDRDNYLTWLAVNILMGNNDTINQNFYLYSPLNSNKWFFLPWDYDGAWGMVEDDGKESPMWQDGIGRYWSSTLHQRFFKDQNNINGLNNKLEELTEVITPEQTTTFLKEYYDIVNKSINKMPDIGLLPIKIEQFTQNYWDLVNEPERNIKNYYESLEKPMPVFLWSEKDHNNYKFQWGLSYDLQGDDLFYTFQISKDPLFTNIIDEKENLQGTSVTLSQLTKGQYYWRIIIKDNKGNQQIPFDIFVDHEGEEYFGIQALTVN